MSNIQQKHSNCKLEASDLNKFANLKGDGHRIRKKNKYRQNKQRIKTKSSVEKIAIQGLCLLGSPSINFHKSAFFENAPQKRLKRQFSEIEYSKDLETIQNGFTKCKKIIVELENHIGKNGEMRIKTPKNSVNFACPTTYPFALVSSNYILNNKKFKKVMITNI
ncbi:hypothetical protein M0813_14948 [Anaeramoeba flamelloides]|uniref:Uncharacterized protein n=1 Tax=Anaeramoeba flamelloides TaxID=1746091 RepID=A0ABQ8Z3P7_9EUKA|nr:hypothetical protein M0813_14948 [Anaeramoeba flamelloides]